MESRKRGQRIERRRSQSPPLPGESPVKNTPTKRSERDYSDYRGADGSHGRDSKAQKSKEVESESAEEIPQDDQDLMLKMMGFSQFDTTQVGFSFFITNIG